MDGDEGSGDTGGGEQIEVPAEQEQAATETVVPPAEATPPAPPAWDPRAAHTSLEQRLAQRDAEHQAQLAEARELSKRQATEAEGLRKALLGIFDPEGQKKQQAPKYLTAEQANAMFAERLSGFQRQQVERQVSDQLDAELPQAKAQFAHVFDAFGEKQILSSWSSNPSHRSLLDTCKAYEAALNKHFETKQRAAATAADVKNGQHRPLPGKGGASTPSGATDHGDTGKARLLRLRRA